MPPSPATGERNCEGGSPAQPTRRSPQPGAASCLPSRRLAPPRRPSWLTRHAVRLDEMLACGTTTCEIKSGYGLSRRVGVEDAARHRRGCAASIAIEIVSTFLGAHEVPLEFRDRRDEYIDLVVDEMIPAVAGAGLAQWCDVFCETGVFTPAESTRILEAGQGGRTSTRGFTPTSSTRAAARRWPLMSGRAPPIT